MKQMIARFLCVWLLVCPATGLCAGGEGYKLTIPAQYDDAHNFSEGLAAVSIGKKWGFIDTAGNEVVPPEYDDAEGFSEGLAKVRLGDYKTGKHGFIDKAGNEVVPLRYEDAESFDHGLAAVMLDGKWGFIDQTGQEVAPCKYYTVCAFNDGLARVGMGDDEDGLWGFVDTTGREVIPCQFSRVGDKGDDWRWSTADEHPFFECLAAAWVPGDASSDDDGENIGRFGVIDKAGKAVVPFELEYDEAGKFSDGLMAVMQIDRAGYRDAERDDDQAIEGDEDDEEEDYAITHYAKVGFMDTTGKQVIPLMYTCPFYAGNGCLEAEYLMPEFSEGLAAVMNGERQPSHSFLKNGGKFGYIDKAGNVIIPFIYDYAAPFSDGLAYVVQGEKFGFIDKDGNVVVPIAYDCDYYYGCDSSDGLINEQRFFDGSAPVSKGDPEADLQYGLIDKTGSIVVPIHYGWIEWDSGAPATIYSDNKLYGDPIGYVIMAGTEAVLVDQYDYVTDFSEGFAAVALGESKARRWGFIDTTGQEVVPCVYEDAGNFSEGLAAVMIDGKWGYIAINQ